MRKSRECNMDLLRLIASIMVIALHIGAIYVRTINSQYPSYYFTIGNFYHSLTRTAVPIFVILSGSFLLNNINNMDYKYHYKKMVKKIVIPTFIFSLLYVIYTMGLETLYSIMSNEKFNYLNPIKDWIAGKPYYHLWYMYMIIGCYILTPILIKIRLHVGNRKFEILGWTCMVLGIIINHIKINLIWPLNCVLYLGYFILGYSLKYKIRLDKGTYKRYLIGAVALLILVFLMTEYNVRYNILEDKDYFLRPLSPIVVISSICMYIAFLKMKISEMKILGLSSHTFNIYLFHAGVLNTIDLVVNIILNKHPNPLWYIPILTIIVFVISYWLSITLNNISEILNNKKSKYKQICRLES